MIEIDYWDFEILCTTALNHGFDEEAKCIEEQLYAQMMGWA